MSAIEKELKDLKDAVRGMLKWEKLESQTSPDYFNHTGGGECSFCKELHGEHGNYGTEPRIDCKECHDDICDMAYEFRTMVRVLIKEKE